MYRFNYGRVVRERRHLLILMDCGQLRWVVPSSGGLYVGGRRNGIRDAGAIDLLHRLQFGTGTGVPFVCGTAVGLEAMACARGERVPSRLRRMRWIIVVRMNGLHFGVLSPLLAVSSNEKQETAES